MARKTKILLEDDLTGDVLDDGAGETVHFAVDGTSYEIDLSTDNAAALRDDLARYISAARKMAGTGGRRSGGASAARAGSSAKRSDLAEIREWAKANGHEVSERGRIAAAVVEAYDAAQ